MTGTDQVGLVERAGLGRGDGGIGHALGLVAGEAPPGLGQPGPGDLPLDGPAVGQGLHPHAAQLPGHRQSSVLGPGVGLEAQAGIHDQPAQLGRCAGGRGVRGSRTSPCPRPVSRLLVVARHPLANPTAGSAQRGGDGLWALSLPAPPDRLLAQLLLGQPDPPRSTERGDGRRNDVLRLDHLLERNDVLWAKPCQGGTMSCGPHRNDVLRALT